MQNGDVLNPTSFAVELGCGNRVVLPDAYISWDVSLPDEVPYDAPIINPSPDHGSVAEKLSRRGLHIECESELSELARMSTADVAIHKGAEYAETLRRLRFPLGRTGLNGVWFYEAGASRTADIVMLHRESDTDESVLLVHTRSRWNTPGGFMDAADSTSAETAARELKEETGRDIERDALSLHWVLSETKASPRTTDHSWIEAEVYVARAARRFEAVRGEDTDEVKDVQWFTLDSLAALVQHRQLSSDKYRYIMTASRLLR